MKHISLAFRCCSVRPELWFRVILDCIRYHESSSSFMRAIVAINSRLSGSLSRSSRNTRSNSCSFVFILSLITENIFYFSWVTWALIDSRIQVWNWLIYSPEVPFCASTSRCGNARPRVWFEIELKEPSSRISSSNGIYPHGVTLRRRWKFFVWPVVHKGDSDIAYYSSCLVSEFGFGVFILGV